MQEEAGSYRESRGIEPDRLIDAHFAIVKEAMMIKILILDGDESIQMLYSDELTEEGYEIITSSTGPEPNSLIDETRPNLIVQNLMLSRDIKE